MRAFRMVTVLAGALLTASVAADEGTSAPEHDGSESALALEKKSMVPPGVELRSALVADTEPGWPRSRSTWCGGWMLVNDGISVLTAPVFVGIGGYLVAAPVLHWSHGNYDTAFLSFGMRAVFPIAGAVGASAVTCRRDDGLDCVEFGFVGFLGGAAAAMAIDAFALAYDEPPRIPSWRVTPLITADRGRWTFGVSASL